MTTQHIDDCGRLDNSIARFAVLAGSNASKQTPREPDVAHSEGMHCALLDWAASRDDLALHLQAALLRLVKIMDETGRINLPQAEIAKRIRLSERQTHTIIKELVTAGALTRTRCGSIGKGRAPDVLTAVIAPNIDSRDNRSATQLSSDNCDSSDIREPSQISPDNRNQEAATDLFGELDPKKKGPHTPKRKTTPTSKVELNPETKETCREGGTGENTKPKRRALPSFIATEETLPTEMNRTMQRDAAKRGFLNGTGLEQFRAFREHHINRATSMKSVEGYFRTWLSKSNEMAGRSQRRDRRPSTTASPTGVRPFLYAG